jgi:hypothetical protein
MLARWEKPSELVFVLADSRRNGRQRHALYAMSSVDGPSFLHDLVVLVTPPRRAEPLLVTHPPSGYSLRRATTSVDRIRWERDAPSMRLLSQIATVAALFALGCGAELSGVGGLCCGASRQPRRRARRQ